MTIEDWTDTRKLVFDERGGWDVLDRLVDEAKSLEKLRLLLAERDSSAEDD